MGPVPLGGRGGDMSEGQDAKQGFSYQEGKK